MRESSLGSGGTRRLAPDMNGGMNTERTNADLWSAVAAGDVDSFGEIFLRHASKINNFCGRRLADWSIAEDLTSAVFLEAWRRRSEVQISGTSLLPWLYGVANNLVRNYRRADRRLSIVLARVQPIEDTPDLAEEVAERLDAEQRMRHVLEVVNELREEDQEVLALCVWEGLSYQEAATALSVPIGTVRSRLSRVRTRLRELSGPAGHEEDVENVKSPERRGT